ncbi:uncharacterized protein MCYG_01897 [Microsporum canis CBS 113480]|uniref:Uncharacterized protein n=1 Tax=Arthroderma otae (strain ATCC MYA-4605 / CBS 113480) TaxID=554155 RepID=C5FI98_ARTOC|nr:uncharacterized protein MCYG_01897 [Microsporum canis CBS 113480]EEQ29078.1 predicted protein [Microsporum canis CBS 113480]
MAQEKQSEIDNTITTHAVLTRMYKVEIMEACKSHHTCDIRSLLDVSIFHSGQGLLTCHLLRLAVAANYVQLAMLCPAIAILNLEPRFRSKASKLSPSELSWRRTPSSYITFFHLREGRKSG